MIRGLSVSRRYGLAICASLVALLLTVGLTEWFDARTMLLLLGAVMVTALYAGSGPAFLAMVVGILTGNYFVLPPLYTFSVTLPEALHLGVFVLMSTGITLLAAARRRAEASLQESIEIERGLRAEADAASLAKDRFLAILSHELRTPLNPILVWANLLLSESLDKAKSQHALAAIERNASFLAQLIDDLLDVSRIVSGKMRLNMQRVELARVVEAALESVTPAAEAKGIHLWTTLDLQAESITGDFERLQQVVWNLLSNAIKFTSRGGSVEIELGRDDSAIRLSIRDTGEGIDASTLPRVFDRFWQVDDSAARVHGGLGLGLAIVKHLVELHGGVISATSQGVGKGSVFTVILPQPAITARMNDEKQRQSLVGSTHAGAPTLMIDGVRVLLVDDEPDSIQAVATALAIRGADVRLAGSTAQALEALDRWNPDVLVADIGMPVEDGYKLIKAIRGRDLVAPGRTIPAVALTAYAGAEDRLRTLAAGFQKHLAKPANPEELVALVASLAGREESRTNPAAARTP